MIVKTVIGVNDDNNFFFSNINALRSLRPRDVNFVLIAICLRHKTTFLQQTATKHVHRRFEKVFF